jgi:glycosyltransferase involved in cell wall biosynthesis
MQDEVKEIIVIVDGSTDGTLEFLEDFCRNSSVVYYVDNGVNRGTPFSRNRGIDLAKFEYIFMAEDDLELSERFLQTLSSHMTSVGADVICGREIFRLDTKTAAESIIQADKFKGSYVNMKTIEVETGIDIGEDREEPIIASPMLAKTALFREVRYSETYRVNFWREETDFQLSARERGYKLASCPHAICFNFVISNDRGGAHAAVGLRREKWVVINNWQFVKMHESFIRDNFNIGNKRVYILKFSVGRIVKYVVLPPVLNVLSRVKRYLLRKNVD